MDWDFSVGYLLRLEDLGSGLRVLGFRGRSRITTLALRTVRMVAPADGGSFAPASLKDCGVASKSFFTNSMLRTTCILGIFMCVGVWSDCFTYL